MNAALRRKLAFIERYLTPAATFTVEDMYSPCEVARLLRESADYVEMEQTGGATEVTAMLSKHHEAVSAAWRSGNVPLGMKPDAADAAALAAADLDGDDGSDY